MMDKITKNIFYILLFTGIVGVLIVAEGYSIGTIDEVAIYDRALSAAEIQGLYSKSLSAGQHSVSVYATDVVGNQNSETRGFTIQ